jgi:LmbE family N-acetylglucosaminyl deacetylase
MQDANAAGFHSRMAYASRRRAELHKALAVADNRARTISIGLVDQEATFHLPELVRVLKELLRALQPELIFTHPYEGGHPDHDATAFAVHTAVAMLRSESDAQPTLMEMTSYHRSGANMAAFEFLPNSASDIATLVLSPELRVKKHQMYKCYATQEKVLRSFPIAIECFRLAPHYDFTQPPQEGWLWYEQFPWGMTGVHWRRLAKRALGELGIEGSDAADGTQCGLSVRPCAR